VGAHAVAVAGDVEHDRAVEEPVEHGGGDGGVGEDVARSWIDRRPADPARVAAIGYCFGGTMALELARAGADIKVVVGFHPGLTQSNDSPNISGSVLMCVGSDDPFTPAESRVAFEREMCSAGVTDWTLEVYGGFGHSFTNNAAQ
jgi:dienelactone hydrolase